MLIQLASDTPVRFSPDLINALQASPEVSMKWQIHPTVLDPHQWSAGYTVADLIFHPDRQYSEQRPRTPHPTPCPERARAS